jgi:hypothetical protein
MVHFFTEVTARVGNALLKIVPGRFEPVGTAPEPVLDLVSKIGDPALGPEPGGLEFRTEFRPALGLWNSRSSELAKIPSPTDSSAPFLTKSRKRSRPAIPRDLACMLAMHARVLDQDF